MQIVLHCVFALGCLWALVMIVFPVVVEKLAVKSSSFSGMDFDAVVKSRRKYRRLVRICGVVLLCTLGPTWIIYAILVVVHRAMVC
jgi:hypothetical protein